MQFNTPLEEGTLVRRHKRFLADIRFLDGRFETVHCPNTGAMLGCSEPGSRVYCSYSENPKRKLSKTLEIVESEYGHLICVNTIRVNAVVKEALSQSSITQLVKEKELRAEVRIPDEAGRFDFGNDSTFVEVKSVTYLCDGRGLFPDAQSDRALKHVRALGRRCQAGERGVLFFCVPHTGISNVGIAADIDPAYAEGVAQAMKVGVEVIAYGCNVSPDDVAITRELPFEI